MIIEPAPESPIRANFAALEAIGEAMIDAGYTVMTVQESLEGIARVNGFPRTEIVAMPTALFVSTRSSPSASARGGSAGEVHTGAISSGHRPLLLHQLDELDTIVGQARAGAIDANRARALVLLLRRLPPPYPAAVRVLAYVPVCAALAVLLGASATGVAVASVLGALVGAVLLLGSRLPRSYTPLITVTLAFGCAAAVFLLVRLGWDPGVLPSLIAPLVVLLPGALLTTGIIELSTGQMMEGVARVAAGLMQLVLLVAGFVVAAVLVDLPHIAFAEADRPLGPIAPWIAVAVFGIGIVVNRGGRPRTILWTVPILYCAYGAQVLGELVFGGVISAFIGAVVLTPLAVLASRHPSGPAAPVVFLPGFWMLVPGALGLVGVTALLGGDHTGLSTLITTVSTMVAIAVGALLGSALTGAFHTTRTLL